MTLKSVLSSWHFSQREPLSFLWERLIFHQYNVTQSHPVSIYCRADCFESKPNLHMVQFKFKIKLLSWRHPAQPKLLCQHSLQSAVSSREENLCLYIGASLFRQQTSIFNERWNLNRKQSPYTHSVFDLFGLKSHFFPNKRNVAVNWIFVCVLPRPAAFREIPSPSRDTHIISCHT